MHICDTEDVFPDLFLVFKQTEVPTSTKVRGLKKVCVPKIGLKLPAPLIGIIFCLRKIFLMWVGRPGLARAPNNPPGFLSNTLVWGCSGAGWASHVVLVQRERAVSWGGGLASYAVASCSGSFNAMAAYMWHVKTTLLIPQIGNCKRAVRQSDCKCTLQWASAEDLERAVRSRATPPAALLLTTQARGHRIGRAGLRLSIRTVPPSCTVFLPRHPTMIWLPSSLLQYEYSGTTDVPHGMEQFGMAPSLLT